MQTRIKIKVKKYQENQDLYWFTLPQELHPVSCELIKKLHQRTQLFNQYIKNTILLLARIHKHSAEPYCTTTSI